MQENENTASVAVAAEPSETDTTVTTEESVREAQTEIADEAEQSSEPPQAGSDEWFEQDRLAWDRAHGDVDKKALFADEDFVAYAEGKIGVMSLCDIYDGYCRLRDKWLSPRLAREEAVQRARKQNPGSLSGAAEEANEFYTMQELRSMSKEAIVKHWDKVQKSLRYNSK